jgi:hypothetical protein
MSSPALALVPVLLARTGIGASTGPAGYSGHRHHPAGENTDGKQEGSEGGRFTARRGPGASPFPLLPHHRRRQHPVRGCA